MQTKPCTGQGQHRNSLPVQTPIILSVSRSTDIPAFYADWFMGRLREGYALWRNPFNQRLTRVSFERVRVIVFWSKNPAPLIPYLPELDRRGIHYYFQFTLNDYEPEHFEFNVPPLHERISTFLRLSSLLGPGRVIWRFDPIILTPDLSPHQLLSRVWHIGNHFRGHTDKLVFSFVDVAAYRKVQSNLIRQSSCFTRNNVLSAEPTPARQQELVEGLVRLRDAWHADGWPITLATCAETLDLDRHGIAHNRCIDGDLIARLWPDDRPLLHYLRTGSLPDPAFPSLFNDPLPAPPNPSRTKANAPPAAASHPRTSACTTPAPTSAPTATPTPAAPSSAPTTAATTPPPPPLSPRDINNNKSRVIL